jgi:hypothetical protein
LRILAIGWTALADGESGQTSHELALVEEDVPVLEEVINE